MRRRSGGTARYVRAPLLLFVRSEIVPRIPVASVETVTLRLALRGQGAGQAR
jgi:hypothetical protein